MKIQITPEKYAEYLKTYDAYLKQQARINQRCPDCGQKAEVIQDDNEAFILQCPVHQTKIYAD